MKKLLSVVTFTSLFLLCYFSQLSAQPIDQWTFNIEYGFSNYNNGVEGKNFEGYNGQPTKLIWGNKYNNSNDYWQYSSIYVDPGKIEETISLDSRTNGVTLTHENNPINVYDNTPFLEYANLNVNLSLTPLNGNKIGPFPQTFNINFEETLNTNDPDESADIFLIDEGFKDQIKEVFLGNYKYTVLFEVDGLGPLEDYDSLGIKTLENDTTTKPTYFSITAEELEPNNPVPEPSTLILFGLGIFGLAGIARKKIKQ